jgi:hypothetical protein
VPKVDVGFATKWHTIDLLLDESRALFGARVFVLFFYTTSF